MGREIIMVLLGDEKIAGNCQCGKLIVFNAEVS